MAEEAAVAEAGPSSGQFYIDLDGEGNATSPEARAAAAARAGQGPATIDSLTDDELHEILSGDVEAAVAAPGGEAQETGEPTGGAESTGGGASTEFAQLTSTVNQMGTAIALLLRNQASAQAGEAPAPTTSEDVEATAKAALQKVNPTMDEDGIEWLYQNNKAVYDAAVGPIQAQMDRYAAGEGQRASEANVQNFYANLDAQMTKEGVSEGEESSELRQMIRENVVARFAANPSMGVDRMPAIVKDVRGAFTRLQHGTTEEMRTHLRKANDPNVNPAPSGPGAGMAGVPDLTKRAVNSKRKDMDFGGAGSLAMVKGILSRGSLDT